MGSLIAVMRRGAERGAQGKLKSLAWGMMLMALGVTVMATLGWLIAGGFAHVPLSIGWLGQAAVLKTTFSIRGLARAARRVEKSLADGKLDDARIWLYQHLVSRDASRLDEREVAAAAVESVAENASDSAVAPLFYYAIAGLPGALAYRFVNTADAMIGYRDERHEWLGKPAARLDDLLNFLPARMTAALMLLAAPFVGGNIARGLSIWWRDRKLTASPNAGQPMSVAAGVLGVELEKAGHYCLGAGQPLASRRDIRRVIRIFYATVAWLLLLITSVAFVVKATWH
jgi:adenosylcobinamide-phosphate synthase